MDIHNIDEYLDLQDQNQMNLLSTEELTTQPEQESEWHSATAATLDDMLESDNNPYLFNVEHNTEWGLLQNGLCEGINLTQIIGNGLVSNQDNFITPDSLLKQQPTPVIEEKRVTRSRASPVTITSPKKKKKATVARPKKLYCICQQPYNGKPMVQCDTCEEWFHCTCVEFDPDEQEDEDIDWVCKNCIQAKPVIESPTPKVTITIPAPSARQTRGSNRNQSQCLYEGCHNRTRADSYCSDVCARKKTEVLTPVKQEKSPQRVTRLSRMRTASMSAGTEPIKVVKSPPKSRRSSAPLVNKKKLEKDKEENKVEYKEEEEEEAPEEEEVLEEENKDEKEEEYKEEVKEEVKEEEEEEEEEDDDEEEAAEGAETPDTPMSPSQMTEQENPVRRNVIKNMSAILKTIIDTASVENPELFDQEKTSTERAENLAKSIENTMLEELGDTGKTQRRRTCGERYKSKFRSLLYNLKDKQNQVFQVRVITGDLSPIQLVKMSSEDMANPELKSMSEVLRKTGLKNSVMKLDNTPIIKKTHKGDIIMVPNKDNDTNQNMYSEQVENVHIDTKVSTPIEEPKTITSFSPTSTGSKLDPLDDILARIGIPAHDENNKRTSSDPSGAIDYAKKRKVTLDVEELLGEEEDTPFQVEEVDTNEFDQEEPDVEMKEEEKQEEKLPTIWQGRVNMPQVAEFEASARQIGGRLLTEEEWAEVLSPTMWIEGRIPAERVTGYVTQSQYSTSREIVLLEIEPDTKTKEDSSQSQTLLKYLDSRQRYAVVGHNKTKVKDFYLIPLYKVQHIPDCLYVVRVEETKRECDLFLGVLVLTKQSASPVVTKPVYSTPMAAPMYLGSQPSYTSPNQPSYYQAPVQEQQSHYNYGYSTQQPQESQVHPSRQQPAQQPVQPAQQEPYQRRNQPYSYNNRQRNRGHQDGSSHYRPSY